ncbi:MAG: mechanosensitive ion channel family protein [Desulfobulbaceae bacterium]|nr:mechanosensitive ion channel family protein [Desulfobulbaceae bacterium]
MAGNQHQAHLYFCRAAELDGMVAIGFIALWSILSNLSCALFLILFKMFQVGDEIEIVEPIGVPGLKGRVQDFNIMFTSLVKDTSEVTEGFVTQVPNNIFFQKTIHRKKGGKTVNLGQHLLSKPMLFQMKKTGQLTRRRRMTLRLADPAQRQQGGQHLQCTGRIVFWLT